MTTKTNTVTLFGHLGADPIIRQTTRGDEVVNLFIATNRPDYKDENGNWVKRDPQWNNVAVFASHALKVARAAKKGDGLEIVASVELREFTDKNTGEVRKMAEIVCNDRYAGHTVRRWDPKTARAARKDDAAE